MIPKGPRGVARMKRSVARRGKENSARLRANSAKISEKNYRGKFQPICSPSVMITNILFGFYTEWVLAELRG